MTLMAPSDDVPSAAFTVKELVIELYRDMKVVRPAVEQLQAAGIIGRLDVLERAAITSAAEKKGRSNVYADVFRKLGISKSVVLFGLALMGAATSIADILAKLR